MELFNLVIYPSTFVHFTFPSHTSEDFRLANGENVSVFALHNHKAPSLSALEVLERPRRNGVYLSGTHSVAIQSGLRLFRAHVTHTNLEVCQLVDICNMRRTALQVCCWCSGDGDDDDDDDDICLLGVVEIVAVIGVGVVEVVVAAAGAAGGRAVTVFVLWGRHPWYSGLLSNRSSDQSCARGMVHNKIHLIRQGCLRPSIALTVQNRGLKHQSFITVVVVGTSCSSYSSNTSRSSGGSSSSSGSSSSRMRRRNNSTGCSKSRSNDSNNDDDEYNKIRNWYCALLKDECIYCLRTRWLALLFILHLHVHLE